MPQPLSADQVVKEWDPRLQPETVIVIHIAALNAPHSDSMSDAVVLFEEGKRLPSKQMSPK
jgi:hypothetical protein